MHWIWRQGTDFGGGRASRWSRCGVEVMLEKEESRGNWVGVGRGRQPLADWGQVPCGGGVGACLEQRKWKQGTGKHSGGPIPSTGCIVSNFRIASNLEWLVSILSGRLP